MSQPWPFGVLLSLSLTTDRPSVSIGQNQQEMSAISNQFFLVGEGWSWRRSFKMQFPIIEI